MIKGVALATCLTLTLVGCGVKEHNALIARTNVERQVAFGEAMSQQTTEGGRVAVAMAYAGGMGLQQYQRVDTAVDYLRVGVPFMNTLIRGADMFWGVQEQSIEAGNNIYYKSTFGDRSAWEFTKSGNNNFGEYDGGTEESEDTEDIQTTDSELSE